MVSAKDSFAEIKECNLKNKRSLPKIGGVCQNAKRCSLFVFFVVWWCCFSLCVLFSLFGTKNQNGYFLQFESFFVPKRPVFKVLLLFLFCFLFWFSFCLPFQNSIFLCCCPSTPFWETLICLVSLSFFLLRFPFLMFACFFQTNFPNIPVLKPKLLSFWLFLYLFSWFCFCFHVSCFCLSVLMLALCLVCFILFLSCFCFVSCFAFTDYEKTMFPCNSSVF